MNTSFISRRKPLFAGRTSGKSNGKKSIVISIDKRQKFVIGVVLLSFGLFLSEFQFSRSGLFISFIISIFSVLFLLWAIYRDIKDNFSISLFILPFFYSLAFGLFYFLVPVSVLSRVVLTSLYAFGMYSLFLSQNIFAVAAIRTIALLSGARIVSFVITLLSFFFLTNIVFTLHANIFLTIGLIFIFTYPLIYQSVWTYNLQKTEYPVVLWVLALSLCIIEAAALLWFWPTSPTVIALFLTGFFYTMTGLTHVWFEKRLFRGVLWEYLWVGVVVFFVLLLFSSWGK
jgi:hypothetical protein